MIKILLKRKPEGNTQKQSQNVWKGSRVPEFFHK